MEITVPVYIAAIVRKLPMRAKLQLPRELEKETWAARLDQVVKQIRTRRSIKKLSIAEINRIVENVRKNRHARTTSRRP